MKAKNLKKRIIITIVVIAVCAGMVYGGSRLYLNKTVAKVMPVENIMTDYEGEEMQSGGILTNDSTQAFYLSDGNVIEQVYVEQGQQVSAGTPLLKYDTSEVSTSLQDKQISIQQTTNDMAIAQAQLDKLRATTPVADDADDQEETQIYQPTGPQKDAQAYRYLKKDAKAYSGVGSQEDPLIFLCTADCYATSDFLKKMEKKEWYCIFEVRADNKKSGEVLSAVSLNGKHLFPVEDNKLYTVRTGEEYIPPSEEPNPSEKGYTKKELRDMINDKEEELIQLQSTLRSEQLEIKQLQEALSEATVTAKNDGVVKKMIPPDEFEDDGTPFLIVSASEGMYVKQQVSEYYVNSLKIGQKVHGTDWVTGTEFEATIERIEDTPVTGSMDMDYGMSGANASYYNCIAYVEDTEGLEIGDSVDLKMTVTEDEQGIFIEKAFCKQEGNDTVVYIQNKKGRLKRQKVTTGRVVWGSYVEVLDGLSQEDNIAFPYSDSTKEGVRCEETDYLY